MNDEEFTLFHARIHRRWMSRKWLFCILPLAFFGSSIGAAVWPESVRWVIEYRGKDNIYRIEPNAEPPRQGQSARGVDLSWPQGAPWTVDLDLDYGAEGGADHLIFPLHLPLHTNPKLYFRYRLTGTPVRALFQLCNSRGRPLTNLDWDAQLNKHSRRLKPTGKVETIEISMEEYEQGSANNMTLLFVEAGKRRLEVHALGFSPQSLRSDENVVDRDPSTALSISTSRRNASSPPQVDQDPVANGNTSWAALPESQQELLSDLENRHLQFFIHWRRERDGLIPDRAPAWSRVPLSKRHEVCSVGGMGFAFACWVRAEQLGLLEPGVARDWTVQALQSLDAAPRQLGLLPHFTLPGAEAAPNSESSTIDHSLLISGIYIVQAHVGKDQELDSLARRFTNVRWDQLLVDTPRGRLLSMGVDADGKVLESAWDDYNEGILAWVIAAGAKDHPVNGALFEKLARERFPSDQGFIAGKTLPLFVHQYPALFWGARPGLILPGGLNVSKNSLAATEFNRQFCRSQPHETFDSGFYGLTACDVPIDEFTEGHPSPPVGYAAFAPATGLAEEGVVCPAAVLASACFDGKSVAADFEHWKNTTSLLDKTLGDLGFADSFRVDNQRIERGDDAISITVGSAALGIADYRDAGLGSLFRRSPAVSRGLTACGISTQPEAHAARPTTAD